MGVAWKIFILVDTIFEIRENGMGMLLIFLSKAQRECTEYLKFEKSLTLLYTRFDCSMLPGPSRIVFVRNLPTGKPAKKVETQLINSMRHFFG